MCIKCNDIGYIINNSEFKGFCDCEIGRKKRNEFLEKKLELAGIFKEYWYLTINHLYPQSNFIKHLEFVNYTKMLLENIMSVRNSNLIWIIYGKKGVGKTLAASLVLIEAIKHGCFAKYILWQDLLQMRINNLEYFDKLKKVEFLTIDKINSDSMSDPKFPSETLDIILTYRYSNQKPTILILDTDLIEAKKRLPVILEIEKKAYISEVDGLDYRIRGTEK